MKKLLLSLVLCVLSIFALVSCNNDDGGIYTIDYYFIMNQTFAPEDLEMVQDEMNEIIEEKIGCRVKLHPVTAWSYDEKLNLLINSGDKFDICFTSTWTNNFYEKVQKEAFYDISDLIKEYAPTTYANVPEYLYDAVTFDGAVYAVINLQILPRTSGLCVEKASFEAWCSLANKTQDDIKSIEDIKPYLQYVKQTYPNAYNIVAPDDPAGLVIDGGFDVIFGMTYPGAVQVDDDPADGLTVVNQFATDYYKNQFLKAVDYYEEGLISKSVLTKEFDYTKGYCWLMSTWKPGAEGEQSQIAGREMLCIPVSEPVMYNSWASSDLNAISSTSEHPELALQFLELLNTDKDLYNLLAFGIEGVHYEKVSENRVNILNASKYTFSTVGWQFTNQFNAYVMEGQEDNVWEETKQVNESATKSPLMGFTFDSSKVELELTNCYQAYMEFINSFIYGIFLDDDKPLGDRAMFNQQYNKFINKLKIAGSEKVIAEMQKQVDAWLESQK